jgi:hypothetical protein
MSQMRNIYFSDEAFELIEQPMYENGKILQRSAKINRLITDKIDLIDNEQVQYIKDNEHKNRTILRHIVTAINELDRFDKILLTEVWRKDRTSKKRFEKLINNLCHVESYFMSTIPPNEEDNNKKDEEK